MSRRMAGAVAAVLAAATLATACSDNVSGTPVPGASTSVSASGPTAFPSGSSTPSAPSSGASSTPASSSPAGGTGPQPVSDSEFLTAAEAGHPKQPQAKSGSKTTTPDPLGCLDVAPLLKSDPTLKRASFKAVGKTQNYNANSPKDASFLIESVINTTSATDAALIARVLGKALAKCTAPKLHLFGTDFKATKAVVSNALGCQTGTTSLTLALGRPPGADPNHPLAVEIDSYAVQKGAGFAYVLKFYPLIQGDPATAAVLAATICKHLP